MAPTNDMFLRKIDKLFHELPNVFSIANDMLIAGFNELDRDHDETVDKVLKVCREAKQQLNKYKCHFRCTIIPFIGENVS